MGSKQIQELVERGTFDGTVNIPVDDTVQTYKVTGAKILEYIRGQFYKGLAKAFANTGYAAVDHDTILWDTSGGNCAFTLPAASAKAGAVIFAQKTDVSVNTVTVTSASTINGKYSLTSQYEWCFWVSDGTAWYAFTPPASTGGGGSGIEQLLQKLEMERMGAGLYTETLDKSVGVSGMRADYIESVTGQLLKNTSSGATALEVVWSPDFLNTSDKDCDATTNWTATGAGATLTTDAGTKQIGTASLKFDKNGTGTAAGIRYDRSAQNFLLYYKNRLFFYIYLPSITQLSNVYVNVFADTTSNYRQWTRTADMSGTPLAIGWNLISVDLSDTTGSTTGGTGWTYAALSRYVEIGVNTSVAGQTYTGICVDSIAFGLPPGPLGILGNEFTLCDTSNKQEVIFDIASTYADGRVTLKAATTLTNTATGGSAAAALQVRRITTSMSGGVSGFNSALTSGSISTVQEMRLQTIMRESATISPTVAVDVITPQFYKVTAVGGSTIGIADSADHSANLKNTNVMHVFRAVYPNGRLKLIHRADKTMTADATASGGTTTLTLPVSGIQVGDYIAKKHLTSSISVVSENSNENFQALTPDASPNGIQVVDRGFSLYPNPANVLAHYRMGDVSQTEAFRNRILGSNVPAITLNTGSINTSDSFLFGRLSASGQNDTNYMRFSGGAGFLDGVGEVIQQSFWVYVPSGSTANQGVCTIGDGGGTERQGISIDCTNNRVGMWHNRSAYYSPNNSILRDKWNHIVCVWNTAGSYMYVNGGLTTTTTTIVDCSGGFYYMGTSAATMFAACSTLKLADMVFWKDGAALTAGQIASIYNGGNYIPFDGPSALRYRYTNTNLIGQKLSLKAALTRTTTAITPAIVKAGAL